jgi:lipopolysaccharide export system ATP-binding protein
MEDKQMVLRTEDLVKKYRNRTVVNHVSVNVKQGEIVGLLGPNGAGKTTTFYMTVGLVTPNNGRIFLDDLEITDYPVYKRARQGIGYLAQEASVFRKMTVEDNLRAVLEMADKPKSYQKKKIESLIEEFGLQKVRKNLGDRLSEENAVAPKSRDAWLSTLSLLCLTNLLPELTRLLCRTYRQSWDALNIKISES